MSRLVVMLQDFDKCVGSLSADENDDFGMKITNAGKHVYIVNTNNNEKYSIPLNWCVSMYVQTMYYIYVLISE